MGQISQCCRRPQQSEHEEPVIEKKPAHQPGWAPVPEGSGCFTKVGCCGALPDDPKQTDYILTLKNHLANSYYLTGSCCLDYLLWICNWHPLLGVFLCHPNHPWSKVERITMDMISLSITVVPAAWIVHNEALIGEHANLAGLPEWTYPYIFITIPDILIGLLLYQLAVHETRECCIPCCDKPCHRFVEFLKKFIMIVCLILGVAGTVFAYMLLKDGNPDTEWTDLVKPLGRAYAVSWSFWFVKGTLLPCQLGFISNWSAGPPTDNVPLAAE